MALDEDKLTFWDAVWGRHWCTSVTPYSQGNLGTPGAVNDPCPTYYIFDLTGAQEVPANASVARGVCTLILNRAENEVGVECTHNVAGVTAAHIHAANGMIQFTFSPATSPMSETFSLTLAQRNELVAGNYYVNVHSGTFSGGEIRGQIVPATLYTHYLSGTQEVPAVPTSGIGVCAHAVPFGRSFMEAWCTHNLATPTAAHIHNAAAGVNGPILVTFASPISAIHQRVSTDPAFLTQLDAGNLYVNVHTAAHVNGEIRGQIP